MLFAQRFPPCCRPQVPAGERKIYLLIEGPTENSVKRAKQVRGTACLPCPTQHSPLSHMSHA